MRSRVVIVQVRATDLQPGDVVNRRGPERNGWAVVDRVEHLHGGEFVVHDVTDNDSFTAKLFDLVWIQMLEEIPDTSEVAAAGAISAAIPEATAEAIPEAMADSVPATF